MTTSQAETDGLVQLAQAMKSRMGYLGLTITDVGERGGPQRGAMREILNARRTPRISTLHDIDTVLGWPDGVAADILNGRRQPPAADEWVELPDENRLGLMRSQLLALGKETARIRRTLDEQSDTIAELLDLIEAERAERQ